MGEFGSLHEAFDEPGGNIFTHTYISLNKFAHNKLSILLNNIIYTTVHKKKPLK